MPCPHNAIDCPCTKDCPRHNFAVVFGKVCTRTSSERKFNNSKSHDYGKRDCTLSAKRVIMIDGYVDATTFDILDVRAKSVTAYIYSDSEYTSLRDMHNASVGKL